MAVNRRPFDFRSMGMAAGRSADCTIGFLGQFEQSGNGCFSPLTSQIPWATTLAWAISEIELRMPSITAPACPVGRR
jgi:hypothetical protein